MIWQETLCAPGGNIFCIAPNLILYIRTYLFYVNPNTYVRMPRMHICMPTSDHRVGVINSPRTSHSLSAAGVDAVALPVALRVSGGECDRRRESYPVPE